MIAVECQWVTFDEWTFSNDNETLRLARLLECVIWIGRPSDRPPAPSFDKDYQWLPLYIEAFGEEIVHIYGQILTLYGCGEFHACERIPPLPAFAPIFRPYSLRIRGMLNGYAARNRYMRSRR